jgi:signal transduction histidine kinase
MEQAAREAEMLRIVATLATATSHEINNPLMAVMANLELLERTHRLDADLEKSSQG